MTDLDELEKRFNATANSPVVRLASSYTKALLKKAKREMRDRYIAAADKKVSSKEKEEPFH
jgi:hypothetical protein